MRPKLKHTGGLKMKARSNSEITRVAGLQTLHGVRYPVSSNLESADGRIVGGAV